MLALAATNCGYVLLQLLLLVPGVLQSNSISLQPELPPPPKYLNNLIENVIKERPAETLLLLKRRLDINCSMEELNSIPIPTVRLDEVTKIKMKRFINAKILSVVCVSEIEDIHLLTSLAKDLHRIRHTPIIILLQTTMSNPKEFLEDIEHKASTFSFVTILVIHLNVFDIKKRLVLYRLEPFPTPTLIHVTNLNSGPIFPNVPTNFQNKTAHVLANPFPPNSFLFKDKKTGKEVLSGYMDKLLLAFAKKHNINLQMSIPNGSIPDQEILKLISNESYDLTTHKRKFTKTMENTPIVTIMNAFIVVPCGQQINICDLYKNIRYFLIIMCSIYAIFSIVEVVLRSVSCRFLGQEYRFRYSTFIVNLTAIRGVLGQSINLFGNRRSISMHQFIMIMSIYSIIMTCLFNANLSTLLTTPSKQTHISNFEELRESGLPVIFDNVFRRHIENQIKEGNLKINMNQGVFVSNNERMQMIVSRNLSNAYVMYDKSWSVLNRHQINVKNKLLCNPSELTLFKGTPVFNVLKPNSIYLNALKDFILRVYCFGLGKHWVAESYEKMMENMNHTKINYNPNPLTYKDLQWVWELLGICYVVSILVFIGELCMGYRVRNREGRLIIIV
ncbi:hypothetical protein KR215_003700 [Drosophila sulfurigaster]|nr:hypothetical protein KR215_003700 [Drosophila sulfurigaster]